MTGLRRCWKLGAAILMAASLAACVPQQAEEEIPGYSAKGNPDPTFGGGAGFVIHDGVAAGIGPDWGLAVATDGQGRIVVAGQYYSASGPHMGVWRLLADGSLDPAFNGGLGYFETTLGFNADKVRALVIDGQGRLLAAGSASNGTNRDMALWRLLDNGTPDPSFGGTGVVTHDNAAGGNGADEAWSAALDPSGRIVVAGESAGAAGAEWAVWRFLSDGNLDLSFGGTGYVVLPSVGGGSGLDRIGSVSVDSQGRILAAGFGINAAGNKDAVVVRLLPDGALDTSFGTGGKFQFDNPDIALSDDGAIAHVRDSQGRLVLGGASHTATDFQAAVWRLSANGALDITWNKKGWLFQDFASGSGYDDQVNAITMDGQGRIVAAGQANVGGGDILIVWRWQ